VSQESPIYVGTYESEPYIMLSAAERQRLAAPMHSHDRMTLERGSDVEKVLRSSRNAEVGGLLICIIYARGVM